MRGGVGLAGAGLGAVDIVDQREIGRFGAFGDLHPHGRGCRIVGEGDMEVGVPGQVGDLHRRVGDRDAGMRTRQQPAAREQRGNEQEEQPRPGS